MVRMGGSREVRLAEEPTEEDAAEVLAEETARGPDPRNVYVGAGPITGAKRRMMEKRPSWAAYLAKADAAFGAGEA